MYYAKNQTGLLRFVMQAQGQGRFIQMRKVTSSPYCTMFSFYSTITLFYLTWLLHLHVKPAFTFGFLPLLIFFLLDKATLNLTIFMDINVYSFYQGLVHYKYSSFTSYFGEFTYLLISLTLTTMFHHPFYNCFFCFYLSA